MFVIKCYNDATGRIETVSVKVPDAVGEENYAAKRREYADRYASEDTNTDHVYYAVTVNPKEEK